MPSKKKQSTEAAVREIGVEPIRSDRRQRIPGLSE